MSNRSSTNWIVPLRLVVGFGFAAHGYAKVSRGPANFGAILASMGVPQPGLMAWLTTLLELIGGVSVMIGAFTGPLALPLSVIMLSAMFKVHWQYGFSSVRLKAVTVSDAEFGPIGYELNLLYIVGLITIALIGPAKLSLDYWLRQRQAAKKISA
ncbi:MAG TPA: DoxX family protein [Pyrinomonadaceae bacterium]|nr:DoxX family protein [Pyrinomonadaceae bacterium]